MSTLDELVDAGHDKVRLPFWNRFAYLQIREGAVWCDLYDVLAGIGGGEPVPLLVGVETGAYTTWEPAG